VTTFKNLGLSSPLLKALAVQNHEVPTPIQVRAIPELLSGRDLLGIARTGTGKTAAFTLPILNQLSAVGIRPEPATCHALIIAPTRELCAQIGRAIQDYGRFTRLNVATVYGGVSMGRQIASLKAGPDIVVATPGRLVDVIERGALRLERVKVFVLDEADRMLDLGFINSIRKITRLLPKTRQSMFFSATMPKEIASLAAELLRQPVRIEISPPASTVDRVSQSVIHLNPSAKLPVLIDLLSSDRMERSIVFTRTKRGADKLTRGLSSADIRALVIHGNKSQSQRERALDHFRSGLSKVLVATDIAARGIDIDGISHIVNYDLPEAPESYVHRIGRTARAGATGTALSFCDPVQLPLLRAIERLIKCQIQSVEHPLAGRPAHENRLLPPSGRSKRDNRRRNVHQHLS
jgi:ATP-dependent RNA helicase RhlE